MTIRSFLHAKAPGTFKSLSDVSRWAESIHGAFYKARHGKLDCVTTLTLTANSATTVFNDKRLSPQSVVIPDPMTLNAAAELAAGTFYCLEANRGNEQWTYTCANNSLADRKFAMAILG